MNPGFKQRFRRLFKWLALPFILLFTFRLLYGYLSVDAIAGSDFNRDFFSSVENIRKNYASEKIAYNNSNNVQQAASIASSQKYEKTATVKSKTSQFEKDQANIRGVTRQFSAVVQYEQSLGNKGGRELHLLIG